MENVIEPVWDIIKLMWDPVGRRIQYARGLKKKIEKLDRDAQNLVNRRKDIESELSSNVDKVPTEVCKGWIDDVEKIDRQRSEIKDEYALNKKCLSGLFPDLTWRTRLGRRIKDAIVRIGELKEMSKFEGGFVRDAPPPAVEFLQLPMTIEEAPINRTVQKVMEYIRNEEFHRIGIWGMGGVGKTTIMKALNNLPEISAAFEIVIWVRVSSQGSVEKIQKDVAKRLSLDVNDEDPVHTVAHKIHQILISKKFLLLLDDVWQSLDLSVIGIPNPNEQVKVSKVVLASRDQNVCPTDATVPVDRLSEEEAWNLFSKKVGDVVNNASITPYAKAAAKECDRLPLAIIVLGGVFSNINDFHVWRSKLRELQSPTSSSMGIMDDGVFNVLRYSYEQLGDDNIKQCFLYCALYSEDVLIKDNELIEYWRAEGLTDDATTIIEAYDKGRDILNTLVQKSLLEKVEMEMVWDKSSYYRMHDVLRDLALRITSPKGNNDNNKFLVRAGLRDQSHPKEKEWKQMQRVSLRENNLCTLPKSPECSMLVTLLLNDNRELKTIPDMFFQYMTQLRVLDLSFTGITSLPPSISSLTNLRGLYLNYCRRLAVLPSEVGSLKKLEALHMMQVGVKILPNEIGNLNRLISLLVSSWFTKVIIPMGVIKRLSSLEQLAIGVVGIDNIEKTLDEVASLRNLTKIQLQFPKVEHLEHFISSSLVWKEQRFLNFQFFVNEYDRSYVIDPQPELSYGFLKWTCNAESSTSTLSSPVIKSLLSRCQDFSINGHRGIKRLSEFGMQNIEALKICDVDACLELEILANGDESEGDLLPNLKALILQNLPKLRKIVEGEVSTRSFSNLRSLELFDCPRIKHIFSWSMVKQLANLESFYIVTCPELEDIFEENEIEAEILRNDDHQLPALKFLKLRGLPNLVSVDKIVRLALSSIEEITIYRCNVKSLPRSLVDAPKLKSIGGEREWWDESLEWEDNTIKQRLQPLFIVEEDPW